MCSSLKIAVVLTLFLALFVSTERCALRLREVSLAWYTCDPAATTLASSRDHPGANHNRDTVDANQLMFDSRCERTREDEHHLDDTRNRTHVLQCTFLANHLRYEFNTPSRRRPSAVSLEATAELQLEHRPSPARECSLRRSLTLDDLPQNGTVRVHMIVPASRLAGVIRVRPDCLAHFERSLDDGSNEQWCGAPTNEFILIPVYHAPIPPSLSAVLQLPEVASGQTKRSSVARLLINVTPSRDEQRWHTGWNHVQNVVEVCAAERDCELERCSSFRPLSCDSDNTCALELAPENYRVQYCWLQLTVITGLRNATLVQKLKHENLPLTPVC